VFYLTVGLQAGYCSEEDSTVNPKIPTVPFRQSYSCYKLF